MSPPLKLAGFALALAAAFGGGALLGQAVGPIEVDSTPAPDEPTSVDDPHGHDSAPTEVRP